MSLFTAVLSARRYLSELELYQQEIQECYRECVPYMMNIKDYNAAWLEGYASESTIVRYAKIAMQLKDKTVRDVVLRCRWMTKKESGKRRKEDHNLSRKSKDKKERVADHSAKPPANLVARPNVPPYAPPMLPADDDEISYKEIGGPTGQLLEHNAQVFSQISANLGNFQIQENISLFCQTRDNILTILKDLDNMPETMKQMPPLPVKMNEELAHSILPRTTMPMQT
ncbi:uncharacterized protein LOC103714937 isoform X2 [Phoenix dactylifera]|uniref:Uncharacterized protein LOC103714937 isoform X2 n=1 Tax=Phoenix dactylifera TaxID=42345 RepID=A0A8B8J9B6_PHODC|nr:uncharacterized protein LOC103714937 isoform X2 [Phoenix dactylifera]